MDKKSIFDGNIIIQKDNWQEVFSAVVGIVTARQSIFGELVVKNQNWNVDLSEGTIAFGEDKYPVQFIGSESNSSETWLWGWENVNNFPESIIELAEQTKKIGDSLGLEALTTPEMELSDIINGYTLASISCGLSDENICYYRGPHQNGAVFFGISNVDPAVFAEIDAMTFIKIALDFPFEVNHKIYIEGFLYMNNTSYEWKENTIIAHFKEDVLIEFEKIDENLRITNIQTALKK